MDMLHMQSNTVLIMAEPRAPKQSKTKGESLFRCGADLHIQPGLLHRAKALTCAEGGAATTAALFAQRRQGREMVCVAPRCDTALPHTGEAPRLSVAGDRVRPLSP